MRPVLSVQDLKQMMREGKPLLGLPPEALLTPAAQDFLAEFSPAGRPRGRIASPPACPAPERASVTARSSGAELEAFFFSPALQALKEQICEIGRRCWKREYVDGNGGNIAIKVAADLALCTPTQISKGFMEPADLCLVDLENNQLAGTKKRTSEISMHLQMMKRQPRMVASVHCHPPCPTAFALARIKPPTGLVSEYELSASVALAPYCTPGTPQLGQLVAELVEHHNTILMANHGVVAWSHLGVEDAYWKIEVIDAYCRTLLAAIQLGQPLKALSAAEVKALLLIKAGYGIPDPRHGLTEEQLHEPNGWPLGQAEL